MPDIRTNPTPTDPLRIIRDACVKARAVGAVVSTCPDLGVVCHSTESPAWETEHLVPILSPLGAVLMVHQPQISQADAALSHVLGVGPIWVLGFDDAVSGGAPDASNAVRGPAVRLYGDGFRAGAEFRARFAAPVEILGATVIGPISKMTAPERRSELQAQLAQHSFGDIVRALISGVPTRDWSDDDKFDLLETLQELALAYPGI